MTISARQLAFVEHYMITKNALQSAIKAGYSENGAGVTGHRLLKHPKIKEEIARRSAASSLKYEISAERVLQEISLMAFWDPAEMLIAVEALGDDEDGVPRGIMRNGKVYLRNPHDIAGLPEHIRRAIVGWKWTEHGFEVKFADKSKALDQLGRHLSLFKDQLDVTVSDGRADRLARAKARLGRKGEE